jgi:tetratricopeptide (TPR) repeat protein
MPGGGWGSDLSDQSKLLREAQAAHAEQRFRVAFDAFTQADRLGGLAADELLAWSDAAWWLGRTDQALQLAELGHRRLVAQGETIRAAKEAIGLGFLLLIRGDLAAGSGWLQRGRATLERSPSEEARGYVTQLDAQYALDGGEIERAVDLAREAEEAARGAADPALLSLALMTEGTARFRTGEVAEAMAVLDEAMLPVQARQVPPEVAGNLYCQMIAICWELADLRRPRQWTVATERWCAGFDSSVMFSGICRLHRVKLRQLAGEWDVAAKEARVVCTELVGMNAAVVAEGHYLLGDLLRLRTKLTDAEAAYLRARELGRDPRMLVGGVVQHDHTSGTWFLPPEHGAVLTRRAGKDNLAKLAQFVGLLASVEHEVVACFREGGGVPHAAYPEFDLLMAEDSKDMAEALLIDGVVPLVNGLAERLEAGISVADIGCGSGHHHNLLAGRYLASRFVGYDFSANA